MSSLVEVDHTSSGEAAVNTLTHTFGGTPEEGYLIAAVVYASTNSSTNWNTPAGYTKRLHDNGFGVSRVSQCCYAKVSDGSETDFTFTIASGSCPMDIIVFIVDPEGLEWVLEPDGEDDFAGHGGIDISLGGIQAVQAFLTDEHAGPLADRFIVASGYIQDVGIENSIDASTPYVVPGSYIDAYPGDGTPVPRNYASSSSTLDTVGTSALWYGFQADADEEPDAEYLEFTTDSGGSNVDIMWSRWAFELEEPERRDVNPDESYFYNVRTVGFEALPFDLNSVTL